MKDFVKSMDGRKGRETRSLKSWLENMKRLESKINLLAGVAGLELTYKHTFHSSPVLKAEFLHFINRVGKFFVVWGRIVFCRMFSCVPASLPAGCQL